MTRNRRLKRKRRTQHPTKPRYRSAEDSLKNFTTSSSITVYCQIFLHPQNFLHHRTALSHLYCQIDGVVAKALYCVDFRSTNKAVQSTL
jgi:hypothetical protein